MKRRQFLIGSSAALALTAVSTMSRRAAAAGELRVPNWQGYGTDEAS